MKKWIGLALATAAAWNLWAQAPEMFRYQGRLVDGTNLVNATLPMSFKLYDALSDGTLYYEDSNSVLVVDGLYSTMIGDDTISGSLTNALTNATVYLELTVDGETLSPRERVVSVPYALNAGGDSTPSGSVVLSETYPNPELEAQGYSVVEVEAGRAWEIMGSLPSGSIHAATAFREKIWIFSNDHIWHSEDGTDWEIATTNVPWTYSPELTVFDDQLWGGYRSNIWSSADGTNWTLVTDHPGWDYLRDSTVFDGKLWVLADQTNIWWSVSGSNWTQSASTESSCEEMASFNNKLWVFGGNKMHYSSDGTNWISESTVVNYPDDLAVLNNMLYYLSDETLRVTSDGQNGTVLFHDESVDEDLLIIHQDMLWRVKDSNYVIFRSTSLMKANGLYHYRKD